jgi:ParB family transcriptional regulator, chromosome partitioning protein
MRSQRIEQIPIHEIRIINPRSRNRVTFQGIVNNIANVGLKKPITVFRRDQAQDGTRYDLVCGQGRLEAVAAIGGSEIPAIVTEATLKQRYLMSLIENVARKRPPHSDLLNEVRTLQKRGYTTAAITEKLGLGKSYVQGILVLLARGENRLVERVEAGTIPLSIAIRIATARSDEVQKALSEAYSKGDLRGAKFRNVHRLIANRSLQQGGGKETAKMSRQELVREYELQTARQRTLVKRASVVRECLAILGGAMTRLLADSKFVQMLQTEGLDTMPQQLAERLR